MENSERVKKRRIEWLDLAKGLCIIFVVLGHSGSHWYDNMLSWFRMPLFFFLSGLLFKPILEKNFLVSLVIKWERCYYHTLHMD
ncbi:acyltransferase family protein [Staphylococcus massiliensis]|uniref:acyltransferase family protein n=1 Tax=Staphylococcus massiliensis TaxID=555791 RepID=UPI001EDF7786|nr:acyltransferase family protein [Staphylococcus massiliensis]MCG3413543.1 acyltransferase family protein [Staphylococcus massiliensis]